MDETLRAADFVIARMEPVLDNLRSVLASLPPEMSEAEVMLRVAQLIRDRMDPANLPFFTALVLVKSLANEGE